VRGAERLVKMGSKLLAILNGDAKAADATEGIELARLCQDYKQRSALAARFYAEAFAEGPATADDLKGGHRSSAACAAALAGCGQGTDADELRADERARLRRQALDWLRADVSGWGRALGKGDAQTKALVQQTTRHWQTDADLAGLRDRDALDKLPEAERKEWQQLWADVAALLRRAAAPR
jgi:hypothetical protein